MKRITLVGDINAFSSYGLHGIQIVRDLERLAGVYATVRPISICDDKFGVNIPADILSRIVSSPQPEQWELLLRHPNFAPTPKRRTAYFTMYEATRLPPRSVFYLNAADVVIVPSAWNASCFDASGVETPIRIVPLGVNTRVFNYQPYPESIKDICVFGTGGWSANGRERKGISDVIEAFFDAFPVEQDVELRVKSMPDEPHMSLDPRVKFDKEFVTEQAMAKWYAGIHCFVSAARAEGWGLMQHEAMACGRPVIGVAFGGVTEFFDSATGYAVEYKLENAKGSYEHCGVWAEPDRESLIHQMREVYRNRQTAIEKGAAASEKVRHLSWENSCRKLVGVLEEVGAIPFSEWGSVPTQAKGEECGVIAYLPPKGIGHTDVFLKNMREWPTSLPVVYLTDGDWPNAFRIIPPPFDKSDEIASYVFLQALEQAELRGWNSFIYIENDCRVAGDKWDEQMRSGFNPEKDIAAGNKAICNPRLAQRLELGQMLSKQHPADEAPGVILWQGHPKSSELCVPFVNGAPAIYSVKGLRELFPSTMTAAVAVRSGFNVQDRLIGERAVVRHGLESACNMMKHVPEIVATAGEDVYRFERRVEALESRRAVAVHPIKNRWRPAPRGGPVFYHSGDLGDLIYCLKAIEIAGGGALMLGPECKWPYPPNKPFTRNTVALLAPLLERQPYITKFGFIERQTDEVTHDLNHFRVFWNERTQKKIPQNTLVRMACYELGVEPLYNDRPWLDVASRVMAPVIIHRSARYQEPAWEKLWWNRVLDTVRKECLFVGLPAEHEAFCAKFRHVPFYQPRDFDDMASVIRGAYWFVGNQSFPCSLALAMGRNVIQETCSMTPDCCFDRPNFFNQHRMPKEITYGRND